jgi:glycosyltransferase involved in cell wall biosynthesis
MQENFLVSVIIPVYNNQKYIGRCLRSLKVQSLNKKNFEVVIIDDSSRDHSMDEILKQKTDNFQIIKNKKNLGLPRSLNIGILKAKGSFVVRVDSDDWVHKDFLNILSTFLYLNKRIDAVACDYTVTDNKENNIKEENCLKKPIGCGIMFRMQHLLDINLYNEKFKYAEDEALRKEFLKKYSITRIPLSLYRYRKHENNHTKNKKKMKFFQKKLKLSK